MYAILYAICRLFAYYQHWTLQILLEDEDRHSFVDAPSVPISGRGPLYYDFSSLVQILEKIDERRLGCLLAVELFFFLSYDRFRTF